MRPTLRTLLLAGFATCLARSAHAADPRFIPTTGAVAESGLGTRGGFGYDPTSAYDQKGLSAPRGFAAEAPAELIDPFTGNLVLRHTDLRLPGVAGLNLVLERVYNSKIHRNYATRIRGDVNGMSFVPPSPVGLGWTMHLGRLVGGVSSGPNSGLPGPRYYERGDGSQHPFFAYTGPSCGNGSSDVCLLTKAKDNPYRFDPNQPWGLATVGGLNITFGHRAISQGTTVDYATLIRDVHGNQIQIVYHDDIIEIDGTSYQYDYLRHFIRSIVDSAGRQLQFGYAVVNPGVIRLSSITANGRTYRYFYSTDNPWPQTQAFLSKAQPPEGAPWLYDYRGLQDGECGDNSKRWCELTSVTYPAGGAIDYDFGDQVFWARNQPMSVRAVAERSSGGRETAPGTWTYQYNRADSYAGDEHTVITRPGGAQEVFTYFGVGSGAYAPAGLAWKAGVLLKKRVRDASGNVLQTETYEWAPSKAISNEAYGDYWIGFDTGIFEPNLRELTVQRDDLTWTTTNTSFNSLNNSPRCTTEQASDGSRRYRLQVLDVVDVPGQNIHFWNLPSATRLSYDPPPAANCDEDQPSLIQAAPEDEFQLNTYDSEGELTRQQVNGVTTDFRYNSDGELQAQIVYQRRQDGMLTDGRCTVFGDYQYGVARQIVHGAATPNCTGGVFTEQKTVDWFGSVTSATNGVGHTRQFSYDGMGRIKEIQPPGETPLLITYVDVGGFTALRRITQGSFWLETLHDGFGRKLEAQSSAGDIVQKRYDVFGRIVFSSLPAERVEDLVGDAITYDDLGRILTVTHPDGTLASYAYGTDEHTITRTDEGGRNTVETLRAFGAPEPAQIARIQLPGEAAPASDNYTYLVGGRLTGVNYAGRQRSVDYNFAKQAVHTYTPEGGHVYFGYDPAGNLRCRDRLSASHCSDGNFADAQAEARFVVDAAGRVAQTLYSDEATPDLTFTYDSSDNLATLTDGIGTHTFTYTLADRLARKDSVIGGVTYSTTYGYDVRGNLETLTYPSGRSVTYERDSANRITGVRDALNTYVSNITYHPSGGKKTITYGNGVVTSTGLDGRQRPDVLNASGVLQLNYNYDDVGNVSSIIDGVDPQNNLALRHDALDRLTHAGGPWGSIDYTYNAAGDRLSETVDGNTTTYAYDASGRLGNLSGSVPRVFLHDAFGNQIQRADFGLVNVLNYTFDLENRLTDVVKTSILGDPSPVASYLYDGQGRRVVTRRGQCDSVVDHYDQQGARIAQSTESGLTLKEYVLADGVTVAELDVRPLTASADRLDFGNVEPGASVTRTITLLNRTSQPFVLQTVTVTPGFRLLTPLPITVSAAGPGGPGSRVLSLEFQPSQAGVYAGSLSSCDGGFHLQIPLDGTGGSARAGFDLQRIEFGTLSFGAVMTRTMTVTNSGSLPLVVTGWSSDRPGVSVIPAGPVSVPPGGQQQFTVRLDTSESCGNLVHAIVSLQSNSIGFPDQHRIDVYARVRALEIATEEFSSGAVAADASHTFQVPVHNLADVPLALNFTLSGAPQFQLASLSPIELAPGESVPVEVRYQPTQARWSPFGDQATLRVRFPNCRTGCDGDGFHLPDVHLIGNVPSGTVPRGGSAPSMAVLGGVVHLVSRLGLFGSFEHNYVQYGAGGWSLPVHPSAQSPSSVPPRFLAAPGGRITFLYNPSGMPGEQALIQRAPDGSFGQPCAVPGLWGDRPLAADAQGNTWVLRRSVPDPHRIEFGPVFSAQGQCLASQTPPISWEDPVSWSHEAVFTPGPAGIVYLVGWYSGFDEGSKIYVATIDMTALSVNIETFAPPGQFVAYPVMAVDQDGVWHLVYYAETDDGLSASVFHVSRSASGIWGTPRVLVEHGGDIYFSVHPSLAVDGRGGLHVASLHSACRTSYSYATLPPGGTWQVSLVSSPGPASARDVPSSSRGIALGAEGDRVAAVWISAPFDVPGVDGKLSFGQIDLGAAGPPASDPILVWDGTISDGETAQRDFTIGPGPDPVEILFSLAKATRSACQVELVLGRPDGRQIGPYLLDASQRTTLASARSGRWSVRLQSTGGCVAEAFHVEVRRHSGTQVVLGFETAPLLGLALALLCVTLARARRAGC